MVDPHRRRGQQSRRISRRKWLSALGLGGAAGLAGCSGQPDGTETPTESATETDGDAFGEDTDTPTATEEELPPITGNYRTVTSSAAQTLNPLYNTESGAGDLISFALDSAYGFQPGIETFQLIYDITTEDNQVWVMNIRDGLEYSDPYGQVTASDFVYQVQEVQQAEWTSPADSSNWTSDTVENIEETGELQFQVELPTPRPLYPESFEPTLFPIPEDLMAPYVSEEDAEGLQQDEELNNLSFTGNLGPYTLEERNPGGVTRYSRNENYYLQEATDINRLFEGAPYFEGLENQVVGEVSSRLGALRDGEVDTAGIPNNRVSEFQNDVEDVYVNITPQPFNEVIVWNFRANGWNAGPGNLFRNTAIRQGLAMAVNKNDFVEGILRGLGRPQFTWQPRYSQFYPGDENLAQFGVGENYGPDVARQRIQEGLDELSVDYGYDSDGRLLNPEGNQVTLDIYHSSGQPVERSFAEFVAQEYQANAGIQVEVNAISGAQFARQYWQQQQPENADELEYSFGPNNYGPPDEVTSQEPWDMTIVFGLNTFPLNPFTNRLFFVEENFYNPAGYVPEWNAAELFQQASEAETREELQEVFTEIFIEVSEAVPYGMMATTSDQIGYRNPINGPIENFFSGWDFAAWHRDQSME